MKEDIAKLGNEGKGEANPLFVESSAASQQFVVHYGTEPLINLHLAGAYCKIANTKASPPNATTTAVTAEIKSQE